MPPCRSSGRTSGRRCAATWSNHTRTTAKSRSRERMLVDLARGLLHALVFEEAAHELRARILRLLARRRRRLGQQQARLDLDQHRGHQQVLGGELELRASHHLDVAQVLARELRHRDVEHVDVLLADEVEQQVERPLERLEEDLERLRRDVEVVRQLVERLAVDARERLRLTATDARGRSRLRSAQLV